MWIGIPAGYKYISPRTNFVNDSYIVVQGGYVGVGSGVDQDSYGAYTLYKEK